MPLSTYTSSVYLAEQGSKQTHKTTLFKRKRERERERAQYKIGANKQNMVHVSNLKSVKCVNN